jgi:hypothetical protein
MNKELGPLLYSISVWALPIIAITFHEAPHGFVALRLGDDTALRRGRVTFNPLKHIDPMGSIVLPGSSAAGVCAGTAGRLGGDPGGGHLGAGRRQAQRFGGGRRAGGSRARGSGARQRRAEAGRRCGEDA